MYGSWVIAPPFARRDASGTAGLRSLCDFCALSFTS